jgi:muramoyltetrapeptide carboxypeptidase
MSKNIRIVSPAKAISADLIEAAVELLTEAGHHVSIGQHATGVFNYFSGTETERLSDFQTAINDDSVDVIFCARGGYGSIQILDKLDFTPFKKKAKLIIGFSDITVFHIHCHLLGFQTVHATMPLNFAENTESSLASLIQTILGKKNSYSIVPNVHNRAGVANAEIIGGNLAIIQTLIGTDSDCSFNGKILFIEDVSEYVYTIDRMLWSLNKSGKIKQLSGLIVGGMTGIKDTEVPYGKSIEEVVLDHVGHYDYPVCFDFPAGHIADNRAITFGKKSTFTVTAEAVQLIN